MELPNASESGEDDELDVNSFFDEKKSYQQMSLEANRNVDRNKWRHE